METRIDTGLALRAALIQAAAVAVLAVVLALVFSHGFFEDWGWLVGVAAWLACALFTARVLGLPRRGALLGAVLAGVLSAIGVLAGVHWLGLAIAVVAFGLWCGRLEAG